MHFYRFHISDYMSHTKHLNHTEDLAYRRMLDWMYLHEKDLPLDVRKISRLIDMRDHEEAITDVLDEFFTKGDEGYSQPRVAEEIASYQRMSEGGKKGANKRWNKVANRGVITNPSPPQANPNANQEPITKNHKPKLIKPESVSDQVWLDFLGHRKKQKADLTQTALSRIEGEAAKAGWSLNDVLSECVTRGWRSFKAEWVDKKEQQQGITWE